MEPSEELLGPLFRQGEQESGLSFVSLSSGSCGNCGLLTYGNHTIIIDAGIGIRKFQKHLEQLAINPKQILGNSSLTTTMIIRVQQHGWLISFNGLSMPVRLWYARSFTTVWLVPSYRPI